jgi:hypothetical protein
METAYENAIGLLHEDYDGSFAFRAALVFQNRER